MTVSPSAPPVAANMCAAPQVDVRVGQLQRLSAAFRENAMALAFAILMILGLLAIIAFMARLIYTTIRRYQQLSASQDLTTPVELYDDDNAFRDSFSSSAEDEVNRSNIDKKIDSIKRKYSKYNVEIRKYIKNYRTEEDPEEPVMDERVISKAEDKYDYTDKTAPTSAGSG